MLKDEEGIYLLDVVIYNIMHNNLSKAGVIGLSAMDQVRFAIPPPPLFFNK